MEPVLDPLPAKARVYIAFISLMGAASLLYGMVSWDSPDFFKYFAFLVVAVASCTMRIKVPGITGTLSLTFLFVLFGLLELTPSETIVLGALATLSQCYWNRSARRRLAQVIFNISSMALAVAAAEYTFHLGLLTAHHIDPPLRLAAATCVLFFANTAPVALVIGLTEKKSIVDTWRECYFWSLPYYLGGAALAEIASLANRFVGWQAVLLTGPVMYLIYRSYRLYLDRLENEKKHAEEVSSAAPAHHRSAGAGHRRQGPHHARPSAARPGLRDGTRQGTGPHRAGDWRRCAPPRCCTTSASWPCPSTSSPSPAA